MLMHLRTNSHSQDDKSFSLYFENFNSSAAQRKGLIQSTNTVKFAQSTSELK